MVEFSKKYKHFTRNEVFLRISPIFDLHAIFSVELFRGGGQEHHKISRARTLAFFASQGTMRGARQHRAVRPSEPWVLAQEK